MVNALLDAENREHPEEQVILAVAQIGLLYSTHFFIDPHMHFVFCVYVCQIRAGIHVSMFCYNTSDQISDQGQTCKEWVQPFFVFNRALNMELFGSVSNESHVPAKQISNNEDPNPLVEFAYDFFDMLEERRSPFKRQKTA